MRGSLVYEKDSITSKQLRTQEQLWMLLYPTYNSTLSVGFVISKHMTEQDRREASLTIYQYEVMTNKIIPGSEQVYYGSNQITRNGFTSVNNPNITINISYYELSALQAVSHLVVLSS